MKRLVIAVYMILLSACTPQQIQTVKPLVLTFEQEACVIAAVELGLSSPQPIADLCGAALNLVTNKLMAEQKGRAMAAAIKKETPK